MQSVNKLSSIALLGFFLLLFLVGPLLSDVARVFFVNIAFSFLIFSSHLTLQIKRLYFLSLSILALLCVVLNTATLMHDGIWLHTASIAISFILLGIVTGNLFWNVFISRKPESNLILGSISVYILIAILWALVYSMIHLFVPGAFRGITTGNLSDFIYYSIVTQTTLGYGDVVPLALIAKNLAAIQAIIGQFYLAVLVAGLLSILSKRPSLNKRY